MKGKELIKELIKNYIELKKIKKENKTLKKIAKDEIEKHMLKERKETVSSSYIPLYEDRYDRFTYKAGDACHCLDHRDMTGTPGCTTCGGSGYLN